MSVEIDIDFDMRDDTPAGKDPDAASPTLRRYHAALWSKPLPGGAPFALDASDEYTYLRHTSALGDFHLSSDSIIHTYHYWVRTRDVVSQFPPEEIAVFIRAGCTIGGFILFPCNRVDGRQTINQARGTDPKIGDRFDLTLECIRRYYAGGESPLARDPRAVPGVLRALPRLLRVLRVLPASGPPDPGRRREVPSRIRRVRITSLPHDRRAIRGPPRRGHSIRRGPEPPDPAVREVALIVARRAGSPPRWAVDAGEAPVGEPLT